MNCNNNTCLYVVYGNVTLLNMNQINNVFAGANSVEKSNSHINTANLQKQRSQTAAAEINILRWGKFKSEKR